MPARPQTRPAAPRAPLRARLGAWARAWLGCESGAATIPAVIFLPTFIMFMISAVDLSLLMLRQIVLDRAIDVATRDIRLGAADISSHAALKASICDGLGLFDDCANNVTVELFEIDDSSWTSDAGTVTCTDKDLPDPEVTLQTGAVNQMVLMRVCMKVSPMVAADPLALALVTSADGKYALISSTVFVNEPQAAQTGAGS